MIKRYLHHFLTLPGPFQTIYCRFFLATVMCSMDENMAAGAGRAEFKAESWGKAFLLELGSPWAGPFPCLRKVAQLKKGAVESAQLDQDHRLFLGASQDCSLVVKPEHSP